jgi:hypothetical protein
LGGTNYGRGWSWASAEATTLAFFARSERGPEIGPLELDGVILLFVLDPDDLLFYFAKHG